MLRKTVLSLKSPTGAFIAPLRCANANLFNKVQEKLAKNKKAPARHKAEESYLLTTKLYCGKCGALMFGESGVSHTGKMYTYYKCAAAKKKKTCDKKAVRKQWLEDLVVNETMKLVEDDASVNAIYLYDDKVLITFNYKEGTETVAFGEAVKAEKSSDMSARGAPNFEHQIVRFDVLSLCRKVAAHHLPESGAFLRKARTACFPLHKKNFYANRTLVNSLRSSASISRMASRISLPEIFVAAGFSFCRG